MADLKAHLKQAAWTELEVAAMVGGSIIATKMIDERKIFKDAFQKNPQWFDMNRHGAPMHIRWFPGITAGAAVLASTYVKNPWLKFALFGVALRGSLEQIRILTFDKEKQIYRLPQIGAGAQSEAQLDAELRQIAEENRVYGPEFTNGPEYTGAREYGNRYMTSVAAREYGNRFMTNVAGAYDPDDDGMSGPFRQQDQTAVAFSY